MIVKFTTQVSGEPLLIFFNQSFYAYWLELREFPGLKLEYALKDTKDTHSIWNIWCKSWFQMQYNIFDVNRGIEMSNIQPSTLFNFL